MVLSFFPKWDRKCSCISTILKGHFSFQPAVKVIFRCLGWNKSQLLDVVWDDGLVFSPKSAPEAEYLDFPVAVGILTRAFKTRDQLKDPMAYLVQTMRKVREAAKKTEVTA